MSLELSIIEEWATFVDSRVLDDIVSELQEWHDNAGTQFDICQDQRVLGQIQGRREACRDFIAMLENAREELPELVEEQLHSKIEQSEESEE